MFANLVRYLLRNLGSNACDGAGVIATSDVDIHFVSYGEGPPVLLLHGGLSNRLSWFSQIPWLVGAGRRVVLMDTRGHGHSGLGRGELSYRLFAADAVRVLDRLAIGRTDVLGWSDGGNTALLLALHWSERVARMVAISANYHPSGLIPEALADTLVQSSGPALWLRRLWTGAGAHTADLERRVKRLWRTEPDLTPADLSRIQAPTLIIVGAKDVVSVAHSRQLAKALPHGGLLVVQGGGHSLPVTHAAAINRTIGGFLGLPSPASPPAPNTSARPSTGA
jgi:pimeloyl-ACP methyl ester carboxylesterase